MIDKFVIFSCKHPEIKFIYRNLILIAKNRDEFQPPMDSVPLVVAVSRIRHIHPGSCIGQHLNHFFTPFSDLLSSLLKNVLYTLTYLFKIVFYFPVINSAVEKSLNYHFLIVPVYRSFYYRII
jgi:hypothetical protein